MVSRVLRWVGPPVLIAALVAVAGLSLGRVYHGDLVVRLVAGAAAGAVLLSMLWHRAPGWLSAPLSVAAMGGYGLFAVDVCASAAGVAGDLKTLTLDAARNAVPRLLTALIPIEAQPDTVLGPVVLAWLAGYAGAELAVRARRPGLALLPPTLLYAGVLVLVGPNSPVVMWHPVVFAALAALLLAVAGAAPSFAQAGSRPLPGLSARQQLRLRFRLATGLLAGLVAVLAAVSLTTPAVLGSVRRHPTDPRQYVAPPSQDVLDQNPLVRVSGWAANPDLPLFEVTLLGGGPPTVEPDSDEADEAALGYDTRLRLAVLSDWDGVTWHMADEYRSAGRVLPPIDPPPGAPAEQAPVPPLTIEERITVMGLQGRLLPAVSAPRRVEGVRVAYSRTHGTLLHPVPVTSGLTYTVTSVSPSIDVGLLPTADVPSGPAVARYLAVGDQVPEDLVRLAERIAQGEGAPYLRALALEAFLSEHYTYAPDAPSGHAYPNLRFFLLEDPRVGGRRGTPEQFAASFAALGRLMGLPTRVVVGFRTPTGVFSAGPGGRGTVTGAHATAWPEVLFDGVGWVPFDPMPDPGTSAVPLDDELLAKPTPPATPPVTVEPSSPPTMSAPPPSSSAPAAAAPGGPSPAAVAGGAGGGLVALLVLLALTVVLLRAVRRHRRLDRGSAAERVLGAWDDILDTLTLAGAPPPEHLTAAEVAAHAATVASAAGGGRHAVRVRPAVPALADLAAKVNAVAFAAGRADLGGVPDDLAAATAKIQAIGYERALRARLPWWRRLWWRVDPRPLLRRRRPDRQTVRQRRVQVQPDVATLDPL